MASPTRPSRETITEYLRSGSWQPLAVSDHWTRNARADPEREALAGDGLRLSWDRAERWTNRVALGLVALGLPRDVVVVVQLPNRVELPLLRVACEKAGVLCLPVPRTLRQQEMRYCLGYTEAAAVVVPRTYRGFDHYGMVRELRDELPALQSVIVWGDDVPRGALSLHEMAERPWEREVDPGVLSERRHSPTEVSMIYPTTGSSGFPKFVEYMAGARLAYGRGYVQVLQLGARDVVAALSPATGPNIPAYFAAPQVGARVVFLEHFEPEAAFELIERERVTVACVLPTLLASMVRHEAAGRHDLSSLRVWVSSGSMLPPHVGRETEELLGGTVLNSYGAADWGGMVIPDVEDSQETRLLSVGRPRIGTRIRLLDEDGRETPPGEVGQVHGSGPSCASGYYGDPEATRNAWSDDGFLSLGDLGKWDANGNLVLAGRKREMVIRGAQNIYPAEVENWLLEYPPVRQAAVVGMPDPVMGERLCAYVVPRAGDTPGFDDVVAFLRSRKIAPYKLPERLEVVEGLPMVSDTKIDKRALEADVREKLEVEGST